MPATIDNYVQVCHRTLAQCRNNEIIEETVRTVMQADSKSLKKLSTDHLRLVKSYAMLGLVYLMQKGTENGNSGDIPNAGIRDTDVGQVQEVDGQVALEEEK